MLYVALLTHKNTLSLIFTLNGKRQNIKNLIYKSNKVDRRWLGFRFSNGPKVYVWKKKFWWHNLFSMPSIMLIPHSRIINYFFLLSNNTCVLEMFALIWIPSLHAPLSKPLVRWTFSKGFGEIVWTFNKITLYSKFALFMFFNARS